MIATIRQRIDRINQNTSLEYVYTYITGAPIYGSSGRSLRVKCFIHGEDTKPSARIFPDGKLWCYTCNTMYSVFHYCMCYRNLSYSDYSAQNSLINELESQFKLDGIPFTAIQERVKDQSWTSLVIDRVKEVTDYSSIFMEKWVEVNNLGIEQVDETLKNKIFEGLDLALLFLNTEENYKKAWEFLFKLEQKYTSFF